MTEPDSPPSGAPSALPWLVLVPLTLWVTWQVLSGDPDTWASRRFSEEAKVWLAAAGALLAAS